MTGILRPVTEVTICASFIFGVLVALFGSLKLTLSHSLDPGEGRAGTLLRAFNLALIFLTILCGVMLDAHGVQSVLIPGSALAAFAVIALSYAGTVPRAFLVALSGGLGGAGIGAASMVLMPEAFFPDKPVASVNVGMVFFALGALVTLPLFNVLTRLVGRKATLVVFGILCLLPGALAAFEKPADLQIGGDEPLDVTALSARSDVWLPCLFYALYAPLEAAVFSLAGAFPGERKPGDPGDRWRLSGFWGAFVFARLVVGLILLQADYTQLNWDAWTIVLAPLFAAVALGNIAGAFGIERAERGLLLVGLCLGPIAPTLFGMMFGRLDQSMSRSHGTAFGLVFAAGSLGTVAFLPLFASGVRKQPTNLALRVPLAGALALTAVALLFAMSQ